ncbi:MAG: hypothetical protein EA369_04280 [Bradymonadales bacterium]|nr:MAG: hypothetical protein EA369_04280 [Bradymonadales bacterium]
MKKVIRLPGTIYKSSINAIFAHGFPLLRVRHDHDPTCDLRVVSPTMSEFSNSVPSLSSSMISNSEISTLWAELQRSSKALQLC